MAILGCVSCSKDPTLLTNGSPSPEALCQRVLEALASYDTTGLDALRLTRFEHDSVLVPNMPIGQSGRESDLNYAWFLLDQGSQKGIRRAMRDFGGMRLELVKAEFTGKREEYGPLVAHRGMQATVRNLDSDEEFILPVFKTVLEHNGQFKLVSVRD